MNINELYDTAKKYAGIIAKERPALVSDETAVCLIVGEKQEIFSGVTGVRISGEKLENVHAEFNAIMSLKNAGQSIAKQMISVKVSDSSIIQPCNECLDVLIAANDSNGSCAVVIEPDKAADVTNIRYSSGGTMDFLSGFDDDTSEDASGDDFVNGIEIDSSNPFYASEAVTEAVKTFTVNNVPGSSAAKPAAPTVEGPVVPGLINNAAPAPDAAPAASQTTQPAMSMEDIQKQAKKRKKIAKSNFKFFGR